MTFHITGKEDNSKDFVHDIPPELLPTIARFATRCTDLYRSDEPTADFADVESKLFAMTMETGKEVIGRIAEKRDDGVGSIRRDGKSWYRIPPTWGSFICQFGKVGYKRSRYRCRGERSLCPADESLGLMAGTLTRPAARIATYTLAECTPRTTRKILDRFGGMTPSVSTLQRLADSIYGTYKDIEEEVLSEARSRETIPKEATSVSVSLDGVMVNLRKDEHPVGTEKDSEGPAGANWREAACGAITFHDRTGKKLRTISSGQMPERNKLKLKCWLVDEFEPLMRERPDLTYVAVADGAVDNWGFLASQNLDAEVLDFYHASTHLRKASAHALSPEIWFAKWKDILQHERGGAERVIGAIRGLCSRASTETAQKELKVELNYFRSNRYRMNYRDIKQRGLPIGSGIIEAVNKTHVGERLKKSGMRWSISGGQGILTIRSWVKSDRFDFIWSRVMVEFDNRMPVNDNHEPNQKMHKAA